MKIVFLHHANVCMGGIERMLAMKANCLVEKEEYNVTMLTYEQNGVPFPYPLSPRVKCVDLNVHLYTAFKYSYPKRHFINKELRKQLATAINDFLQKSKPDIVVCTDKDPIELKILASVRTTEKIVVEGHTGIIDKKTQIKRADNIISKLQGIRTIFRLKRAIAHYDRYVALTPDDAQFWQQYAKTTVIPNLLPSYPEKTAILGNEKKRIISVGRLNYQKGQDLLLKAWKMVEKKHGDWHLDIFGDGDDRDALLKQISELELKNVNIHPSTPTIYEEYQKSDFLVCSSRWESFGLIIIEAMACGIPVVAFDCDNGPRNIITEGQDGLLAKNGDVADLAEKMNMLIENPQMRQEMGKKARPNMMRYKEDNVFAQYMEFYKSILHE